MISLQNKLYESLLDDEEELISNDEIAKEMQFYEECKSFFPKVPEHNIKSNFAIKNNKITLRGMIGLYIPAKNSPERENCFFRGFSMCPNIDFISWMFIASDRKVKTKYHISEINKYPINIKNIKHFAIWRFDSLDYCSNINIDNIDDIILYNDVDTPINDLDFDFFKCVKNINTLTLENSNNNIFQSKPELKSDSIKNIHTNNLIIDMSLIKADAYKASDISSDYLNDFLNNIYKNNKINNIILFADNKKKQYQVVRGKSKYLLRLIK